MKVNPLSECEKSLRIPQHLATLSSLSISRLMMSLRVVDDDDLTDDFRIYFLVFFVSVGMFT